MKKFLLSIFAVLFAFAGVQAQSYVKVTSAPADWSGDYLIVYEAGNVAFDGSLTTLDAVSNTIPVTISNGEIEATDATNAAKFTIVSNGDGTYTVQSASGYYIGQTSNANGLASDETISYDNTLSLSNEGTANISSGGAYLRFNAASNQNRFRYYKSSSYTGQKAIALYKYTESAGGETPENPEEPEVPEEPETPTTSEIVATYELTQEDMATAWSNKTVSNSYSEYTLECLSYGSWTGTYNVQKANEKYTLGLNATANLQSPVSYGAVESVSIVITNGSSKNRTITLTGGTESKTISVPGYTTTEEIVFDGFETEFYNFALTASGALQISSIEVVCPPSYTLSVSDAGWATMFLGFDAEIVDGAKAYIVKTDGVSADKVTLTEITDAIPANTGVIVKAEQGVYKFNYSTENVADVEGNLLTGTTENAVITKDAEKEYYILADGEEGVGLYKPTIGEDATKFNNAANKAYLVVPAAQAEGIACYSFRFGEGTTGVDQITDNREQSTVIYDLTGRRVEAITAPGIYVVNGKKVLVK